jgi:hypothetical protein
MNPEIYLIWIWRSHGGEEYVPPKRLWLWIACSSETAVVTKSMFLWNGGGYEKCSSETTVVMNSMFFWNGGSYKEHDPPKRRWSSTELHGITIQCITLLFKQNLWI